MNLILLSGLDGTGILFKPFLDAMPIGNRSNIKLFIYDLNEDNNQSLQHQAERVEQQIHNNFLDEPVVVISESYSGLLGYELLTRGIANIVKMVFVACFLKQPCKIARLTKYSYFMKPKLVNLVPNSILKYILFNRFGNDELLSLFNQAMSELENPIKQKIFLQRCKNIGELSVGGFNSKTTISTPCLYLSANQDVLVGSDNIELFRQIFSNLEVFNIDGSHFLLQTSPEKVWEVLENNPISG